MRAEGRAGKGRREGRRSEEKAGGAGPLCLPERRGFAGTAQASSQLPVLAPAAGQTRRASAVLPVRSAMWGGRGGERATPPWGPPGKEALPARSRLYWFAPCRPGTTGKPLGRAAGRGTGGQCSESRSPLPEEAGATECGHRNVIHLEFAWKFPLSSSSSSLEPGSICSSDMHYFFFFSLREREANRW